MQLRGTSPVGHKGWKLLNYWVLAITEDETAPGSPVRRLNREQAVLATTTSAAMETPTGKASTVKSVGSVEA